VKDSLSIKESLKGLMEVMVLKSARDVIDIAPPICTNVLDLSKYKYLPKCIHLFKFMLASGIVTVCLAVFTAYIDSSISEIDAILTPTGSIIFYLSVTSTFVTAVNAYINPTEADP
jgi:hypothetical protein